MPEEKTLFSAEFNPEGILDGAKKTVESLNEIKKATIDLKDDLKKLNAELKENEKQQAAVNKELAYGLNPQLIKENTEKLEKLKVAHDRLKIARKEEMLTIDEFNKKSKEISKTIKDTEEHHNHAAEAIKKFTNVNELAAEGITHVKRRAVELGVGLATGLVGVIIGQALPSIEKLVEGFIDLVNGEKEATEKEKLFAEVFKKAAGDIAASTSKLEIYKLKLNDLSIPEAERLKLAKEYNKTADEGNKLDLTQINNLDYINERIEKQIGLLKERAIAKAAENILADKAQKVTELELKFRDKLKLNGVTEEDVKAALDGLVKADSITNQKLRTTLDGFVGKPIDLYSKKQETEVKAQGKNISKDLQAIYAQLISARFVFDKNLEDIASLITIPGLTTPDKAGPKAPENVFTQKLLELRERLAKIATAEFQSDNLIKKEFFTKLQKEDGEIDKLLKEKKLTGPQADFLKALLSQINQQELEKSMDTFHAKQKAALKKVNDDLEKMYLEDATARVNNIRDELERQKAVIDQTYNGAAAAIAKRQEDLFKQIDDDVKKGLLTKTQGKNKKTLAAYLFSELGDDIELAKSNAQLDLALKTFQKTLSEAREVFNAKELGLSEAVTKDIHKLTDEYLKHEITYQAYQKKLTKILADETQERRKKLRDELIYEFTLLQQQIDNTKDPVNKKKLQDQQAPIGGQINDLNRAIDSGDATDDKQGKDERIGQIVKYANAIGSLTNEIIGFWQKANEAEAAALDRSIALQEKRVAAAQRVAQRGNAEYLRQEEDRLTQLNIKQENAAKRQLAINAVLTASQALTAFVSALAQGAATGGPLGAIISATAIIGLLASGYAIVKSLQANTPKLFKGTKHATRDNGEPAGRDTIAAYINEGEAVIPTATNKKYKPAVEAIYDNAIPAEALNNFVRSYPVTKIPVVNYEAIGEGATYKIGQDGRMVALLTEQNKELRETRDAIFTLNDAVKGWGVNINLDHYGFAVSTTKAQSHIRKQKNA